MQKGFMVGWLILAVVILITLGAGYYYWRSQVGLIEDTTIMVRSPDPNMVVSPSPTTTTSSAVWKTYTNTKYAYQVDYPGEKSARAPDASKDDDVVFLGGCFHILVSPKDAFSIGQLGLSKERLQEISNVQVGRTKIYSTPNWKGMDNFTYEDHFERMPNKVIDQKPWSDFVLSNNWETHTLNHLYFKTNRDYLYAINSRSGGPCPEDEPDKMVSTFKFTQ